MFPRGSSYLCIQGMVAYRATDTLPIFAVVKIEGSWN
jgi:hypothetical protein